LDEPVIGSYGALFHSIITVAEVSFSMKNKTLIITVHK